MEVEREGGWGDRGGGGVTRAGIRTQGGMKALQSPVQKGRQQGEPRGTQRKTARRQGNTGTGNLLPSWPPGRGKRA